MGKTILAIFLALAVSAFGCGGSSEGEDDSSGGTSNGGTSSGGTSSGGTSSGGTSSGGTGGSSGAGSGVSRGKYLDDLTPDEQRRLCVWAIAGQGGPGEKMCDANTTVTVDTVEECATGDFSSFHCLVGMVEDCVNSMNRDACVLLASAECAAYIDCVIESQN